MSHINRTRPRQGLQLVIRRGAGSQISQIFRRASAGSEALPSLARRVRARKSITVTHWLYCAWWYSSTRTSLVTLIDLRALSMQQHAKLPCRGNSSRGDILLEIIQDSPDDRGTLRVRLEQILDKSTSGPGIASSPEAGCGAQPASDHQVRIPNLIKIGREDELEMSGRKKVPSRGRTIAAHLCEHPSLNLARLDRHSMSLTGPEIVDMFLMHSKTASDAGPRRSACRCCQLSHWHRR